MSDSDVIFDMCSRLCGRPNLCSTSIGRDRGGAAWEMSDALDA
jgi:hypothetical protein